MAALAVGVFPALMVLGFGLEYAFGPNSLGGLGPVIAVVGLLGTGGLLGVGAGMMTQKS